MSLEKLQRKIFAVHQDQIFQRGRWHGIKMSDFDHELETIRKHGEFRVRGPLENDSTYKQIIPQILLQVGNKFLVHQITSHGSEARLHQLWPLFVGGHIEEEDWGEGLDPIVCAAEREFTEEVGYRGNILARQPVGLLYIEEYDPVNSFHLGIVYRYIGDREEINPTEKEISQMKFDTYENIFSFKDQLTYWSRMIVPLLPSFLS
jgi:predicted NUDIX family phosphoesterase